MPAIDYNYVAGVISGPSTQYFESGKIKSKGNYKENMEEGAWKEFYESGAVREEGN